MKRRAGAIHNRKQDAGDPNSSEAVQEFMGRLCMALVLSVCCLSTTGAGQPDPAHAILPTAVPEIVALLPSGIYVGYALQAGNKNELALDVRQSRPGGRFIGTVHFDGFSSCGSPAPMAGEIRTAGAVYIESKTGVARGCERTLDLNLAGNNLKGTMVTTEGVYQVMLKRSGR